MDAAVSEGNTKRADLSAIWELMTPATTFMDVTSGKHRRLFQNFSFWNKLTVKLLGLS
jgi:hypothetical protein